MGWFGIWLAYVPDDGTHRQAIDATIGGWFANPAVPDAVEITPSGRHRYGTPATR